MSLAPHSYMFLAKASLGRRNSILTVLVFCAAVFNVADLVTSFIALRSGLFEANFMLIGASTSLHLNILELMAGTKAFFIVVVIILAFAGTKSTVRTSRGLIFGSLAAISLIFFAVSLNNIHWILS